MSKKQKESVESVEMVKYCKDCTFRGNGASARVSGSQGYCSKMEKFVPRKHEICSMFKAKKNA